MNCPNCNNRLSCGCQKRTASDQTQVCTSCISAYEQKLSAKSVQQNNYNTQLTEARNIIYNEELPRG